MYYAVRCPGCLLTIYTVLSAERMKGFSVASLPDESLAFYNCPFRLCEYHVDANHDVNLYSNVSTHQKIYLSAGFTVAPRTRQTKAFRSKLQIDALALRLDITEDLPIRPTMQEMQVGDKAQAAKDPGKKDRQGDAPVPAVAQDVRISRNHALLANSADYSDPTKEHNHPWAEVGGRRGGTGQAHGQ